MGLLAHRRVITLSSETLTDRDSKKKNHHPALVQEKRDSASSPFTKAQQVHADTAGCVELNDGNLCPDQSPRRFFESDREIWHVLYEPLPRPDLTSSFFFARFFVS